MVHYTVHLKLIFMFDIGIGNGLRNCLTRELVRGDKNRVKTYISSAYIMITVIAIAMMIWDVLCSVMLIGMIFSIYLK